MDKLVHNVTLDALYARTGITALIVPLGTISLLMEFVI